MNDLLDYGLLVIQAFFLLIYGIEQGGLTANGSTREKSMLVLMVLLVACGVYGLLPSAEGVQGGVLLVEFSLGLVLVFGHWPRKLLPYLSVVLLGGLALGSLLRIAAMNVPISYSVLLLPFVAVALVFLKRPASDTLNFFKGFAVLIALFWLVEPIATQVFATPRPIAAIPFSELISMQTLAITTCGVMLLLMGYFLQTKQKH